MRIHPLSSLRVSKHFIPSHNRLPNSSITNKPLLIYHSAFLPPSNTTSTLSPQAIESHLRTTAAVLPQWRYTMYPTTHFHSTTHEVLVVVSGRATLCFGGEGNPGRVEVGVRVGDLIVVPAGVGHRLLREGDGDGGNDGEKERFEMVGSYPPGCQWDMCYGQEGEEEKVKGIQGLRWLERDPVYGDEGPVLDV